MWRLLLAIFCIPCHGIDFTQEPRLETSNGHLWIVGAADKNVTLATSGRGVVTVNGKDVRAVVNDAVAAVSEVRAGIAIAASLQDDVRKLQQSESEIRALCNGLLANSSTPTNPFPATSLVRLRTRMARLEANLARNECARDPCRNGGTCIDLFLKFKCLCLEGWTGSRCQLDVNECLDLAGTNLGCLNGATCINTPGGFRCQCASGFFGKDCSSRSNNCSAGSREMCNHGVCVPDLVGHKCICDQGWTKIAGQEICEQDVDECVAFPCSAFPKVNCINIPGSFRCESCPPGYTGNGHHCDDVNECAVSNGGCSMSPVVSCRNTYGSFRCGPCPPGYSGDGVVCNYVGRCRVDNGGCHPQAVCHELGASVQCICLPGYLGPGVGPSGCLPSALAPTNDHPCIPNPCGNGRCVLTSQFNFTCQCFFGFTGPRCERSGNPCTGVECQNGGTCIWNQNSFRCQCTQYYAGRYCQKERSVCGGQLRMDSGVLEFPASSSVRYKANQNCAWWISVNSSLAVEVTFEEFDLEPRRKSECSSDWLQIYDGREIGTNPMLGKFCGNEKPLNGTVRSSGNNMFLWFKSDSSSQHMGFKLRWNATQPVCGGTLNGMVHGVISSPGSPGKYPANRDCHWTISTNLTQRIRFTFFALNIEQHPNCDFDYLEFHDGSNTDSPSMVRHCTSGTPAPFISSGPVVHIHFHSDSVSSDTGFQISYSPVPGIEGCGGVHTDPVGEIRPVMFANSYRSNVDCVWIIRAPRPHRLKLIFQSFRLESSRSCSMDFLEVRQGSDDQAALVGRYCGSTIPLPITSEQSELYIRFRTDASLSYDGFVIRYEQLCEQTFTAPTGVIKSPNYPDNYPNSIDCIYKIELPRGKAVTIQFLDFQLEHGTAWHGSYSRCYHDYLEIRDGKSDMFPVLGQYCKGTPDMIVATHNTLWMKFHTDSSVQDRGWVANYSSIDITCGGIHHELSGVIRSPVEDGLYPMDTTCRWVIAVPTGYVIQLTFQSFQIESAYSSCQFDYLEVSDGQRIERNWPYDTVKPNQPHRMCGPDIPAPIHSSGNIMHLKFVSDRSVSMGGFEISYVAREEKTLCGGNYIAPTGFIKTPNYPNKYPDGHSCSWVIRTLYGQQIQLKTESFALEDDPNCEMDYVEIRNGASITSPLIGRYCGLTKPPVITSFSHAIFVKFVSDAMLAFKGFRMSWDSSITGCGGTLRGKSGTITSPNYPEKYEKNSECRYGIQIAKGNKIELIFIDFELELGGPPGCYDDYLEVFDSGKSLGRRCSHSQSDTITSVSNKLDIVFISDFAVNGKGFHLTYRTKCNVSTSGDYGVIESPGYPEQVPSLTSCSWTVNAELGHTLNLTFSDTVLENYDCVNSYVELREQEHVDSNIRLLGKYCASNKPPAIVPSAWRSVIVTLVTDGDNEDFGPFHIEWVSIGCGGTLTRPSGNITSPNYPAPYHHNVRCIWRINVDPDHSVQLAITDIGFETSEKCRNDGLRVYGGADESAPMLTELCPSSANSEIVVSSSTNAMVVIFWADVSWSGKGFAATYSSQPAQCGGRFIGLTGSIHSRNYPKNYAANDDCTWVITVEKHHRIAFLFEDFDLPKDCNKNYIEVFDGALLNETTKTKYCAETMRNITSATIFNSSSNLLTVRMRAEEPAKGFKAQYSMICGGTITVDQPGTIQLDGYSQSATTCLWVLIAPETDGHVVVTSVDTGSSFVAYEDAYDVEVIVDIYDGSTVANRSKIIEFPRGKMSVIPYTSSGNVMLIRFSYHSYLDSHLSITYTNVASACGGDINTLAGNIANPAYPGSYPANVECVWTLLAAPGNFLQLSWKEFSLEESEHCGTDYVEVRKNAGSGALIGTYCGSLIPNSTTTDTSLWIKFASGIPSSTSNRQFFVEFSHIYMVELTGPSGEIANPLYPKALQELPEDFAKWRITVGAGKNIRLVITDLLVTCDYGQGLMVFDGYDTTAQNTMYCGGLPQNAMVSSTNVIFIQVAPGAINGGVRFKLTWQEISAPIVPSVKNTTSDCGGDFMFSSQMQTLQITSPGHPNRYPKMKTCRWTVRAPPGYHLGYRVTDMHINSAPGCVYESVAVYDGEDKGKTVGRYCNNNDTSVINGFEVGPVLTVVFQSSYMSPKLGFSLQVDLLFGGEITGSMGIIDFNWNGTAWRRYVQSKIFHDWVIRVGRGRKVNVTFDRFDVKAGPDGKCGDAYLVLRNGHHINSPYLGSGQFCGDKPPSLITSGEYLLVRAHVPYRSSSFVLKFQEVSESCGGRLLLPVTTSKLVINSPLYPNSPPPHIECVWVVQAPAGKTMQLEFTGRFDLKTSPDCEAEYVEVLDGGTMLAPSVGRFCENAPSTIKSSDNLLYIKYFTDINEPNNGFSAIISFEKCGGVIRGLTGIIRSPQYPSLQNNMDCTWTIETQANKQLKISFLDFDMPTTYDENAPARPFSSIEDLRKLIWIRRESNCSMRNSVFMYEPTAPIPTAFIPSPRFERPYRPRNSLMGEAVFGRFGRPSPYRPYREIIPMSRYKMQEIMLAVGCGTSSPQNITTSSNKVYLRLRTTGINSGEHRGFKLNFTSATMKCGGELTTPHGSITSPSYPKELAFPYYCRWIITVPLGRRITVRVHDFDVAGSIWERRLYFYEEAMRTSPQVYYSANPPPAQYNATSNTLVIVFNSNGQTGSSHKGFNISYSSDFPAVCGGELVSSSGFVEPPKENLTHFACHWTLPLISSGSYVFSLPASSLGNATRDWDNPFVGLFIYSLSNEYSKALWGNTPMQTFAYPGSLGKIKISAIWAHAFTPLSFRLSYNTSNCGGVIKSSSLPYILKSPNLPFPYSTDTHCAWRISTDEGQTLKVLFEQFELDRDCEDRLMIYNGPNPNSPLINSFCGTSSGTMIVSQSNSIFVEFHAGSPKPGQGFLLSVTNNHTVCGGSLHLPSTIQSPNYPNKYEPNTECEWELTTVPGSHIGLVFSGRFFIERSIGCANDSLQIFDYVNNDWKLIANLCGRDLPAPVNSTSTKMKVSFKSNQAIEADGFVAFWEKNCGGELTDASGIVMSPNYPNSYPPNAHCEYVIRGSGQLIHLSFRSFAMEQSSQCHYDYVTIEEWNEKDWSAVGRYCGSNVPPNITSHSDVRVTFVSDHYMKAAGFLMTYTVEQCGGYINTSQVIRYTSSRFSQPGQCVWQLQAPPNMIVSLQLTNVSMIVDSSCTSLALSPIDSAGNKTLGRVCGRINTTLPFLSSGNSMQLNLFAKYKYYTIYYFTAYVTFTYGPKQGCGGSLFIGDNPETISSPDVNRDGRYEEFLDCHWIISTRDGFYITAKIMNMDIDTCNATGCQCDFLELHDGVGPHDDTILSTCGTVAPDLVVSSTNKMWMRFLTDGSYSGRGFTVQFSSIRSRCGKRSLTATREVQTLTSPGYPSHYPDDTRCTWLITGFNQTNKPYYMRSPIHIYVKTWSTEDSTDCSQDYLAIEDFGKRQLIPKAIEEADVGSGGVIYKGNSGRTSLIYAQRNLAGKTRYCGTGTGVDFYASSGTALLEFYSNGILAKGGFEIQYSLSPCNRNYTTGRGRIIHMRFQPNELCTIEVHAPYPNQTISLYFTKFSTPNDCDKTYIQIKEGLLSTSRELLKACGYVTPQPVYSSGPHIYITMHTTVAAYTDVDITYTSTDQGAGCGGEIFNYGGTFTSPQYPTNVRTNSVCEWLVSVPDGLDLVFQFNSFNLGPASTCNTDYIAFVDVHDNGQRIERSRFCGGDYPARIVSSTGTMTVRYVRSVHNGGPGWSLRFAGIASGTTDLLY